MTQAAETPDAHAQRSLDAKARLAEAETRKAAARKTERERVKRRKAERDAVPARTPEQIRADLEASRARLQQRDADAAAAIREVKAIPLDPQDISISAARKGTARARAARKTLGIKAPPETVAQISARLMAKATAPLPRSPVEKGHRPKSSSPYQPSSKPAVDDPLGQIIFGNVAPDEVLAKSVIDGMVRQVSVRTSSRPIDYMRFRSPKPISVEQYGAAEQFIADHETMSMFGAGNTAAICNSAENAVPWTARDRAVKDAGDMMKYAAEVHLPKDGSSKLVSAAFRVRRALSQLDSWQQSVLKDLLLKDMTIGLIAQRWGMEPEVARFMVQASLWKLAAVYETTNAEFRDWLIAERQLAEG